MPGTRSSAQADARYLDGRDPETAAGWTPRAAGDQERILALLQKLPPVQDDFVKIPLPRVAAGAGAEAALRGALLQYAEEAKVVDARLFRKISMQHKGASLQEVCADLQRQTGVRFAAARGVQDEKVTILLEDQPARDVMREVARLFGYFWSRVGEEGAYKYTLEQDLRSQLAEEEMRNQDLNSALLSLDAQMMADQNLADLSLDQLRARLKTAAGAEKDHLSALARGGWGGLQVYHRMTPAERMELRTTGRMIFSTDNSDPARRLPAEWKQPLLQSSRMEVYQPDGSLKADADDPNAVPYVVLSIDRSELGQLTLNCDTYAEIPGRGGFSRTLHLATGKSPSTEKPQNAAALASLRRSPELQTRVSLLPEPSCPYANDPARNDFKQLMMTFGTSYAAVHAQLPHPHLNSADVWAELHRRTGLPIIADFYSRLYPAPAFKAESITTFDALCQSADNLGYRCRKEGSFVLARSTSYFWDKLKEVPNRLLRHWKEDREAQSGLPLEDLVQMATLRQQQLDSTRGGAFIRHCWGLDEWMIVGGGDENGTNGWRGRARALGCLNPAQLQAAQRWEGLDLGALTPAQQETLRGTVPDLSGAKSLAGVRYRVEFVPSGWYIWMPVLSQAEAGPLVEKLLSAPIAAAKTQEEARQLRQKFLPGTQPADDVRRSTGILSITVTLLDGKRLNEGRPSALVHP